jgi:uncharacterized protein (TIGR00290 family)
MKELLLYWSGGKDCAIALYDLMTTDRYRTSYRVSYLLTTLTRDFDRISGHGVRNSLLDRQAECIGLDVHKTYISAGTPIEEYEDVIRTALLKFKSLGVRGAATGDIFLEKRRMSTFKDLGLLGCFPLQKHIAAAHMERLLGLGFRAYVVCVDAAVLDRSFVGRQVDREFLNQLPTGVDPCGENGEYHTFVYDGPIFKQPVDCRLGVTVMRDGFYFSDVVLNE